MSDEPHGHHEGEHGHDGEHGHGHEHDQGVRGMLRYLRWAPSMWRSEINDAVVDLVAPEPGEKVVDIGAGMGAGTVVAARRGASVVAVEPTPFLRGILRARRWLQRGRDRIDVIDGTAEQLPAEDGAVDAVWAINTMHHWTDLERGVTETVRVLAPGGRVVLVDEDFDDPDHPEHERFRSDHDGGHHGFTMVDGTRVGELLVAAGISDTDASYQRLAGRPVIAVIGRADPPTSS